MRKTITALCIAGAVIVPTTTAIAAASDFAPHYRHVYIPTRACPAFNEGASCFYDAGMRQGSGYAFWRDANGHVHYLDARRDAQLRNASSACGMYSTFCLQWHYNPK